MHRLLPLLVLIGCSAPPKPVATETRGVPAPGGTTTKQAKPPPVHGPQQVAAAPPKTACEQDASSSECKCSQGVADSCFRLSDSEMRRGDHDSAIARVLGMCQQGTPQACFIGAKYLKRLHLEARLGTSATDLNARAITLYEEKCGGGDQAICVEYARLLLAGKYIAADAKRGRQLIEKACEAKQARACLTLGNMYASGQGVKKDTKQAITLLDQACTTSGGAACTALAELLPASDRKRIIELLSRACDDDDADACARVGAMIDGAGTDALLSKVAAPLLMRACELDELKSCVRAAELAKNKEPERARAAFERACDGEVFAACLGLAPMVATGTGGPRNFGEGVALADKVCKLKAPKVPKACDVLAQLRRSPPAVACSTAEACEPLCEEKIPSACVLLSVFALKADPELGCQTAAAALERGCDAGDAGSCTILGNEETDSRTAVRFYATGCAATFATTSGTAIDYACVMRDVATAHHGAKAERARAIASLRRACKPYERGACAWYGKVLAADNRAAGIAVLEKTCNAGAGHACRWLAELIDVNPHHGVGDGSPQPFDEKLDKRVHELIERACKLSDHRACKRQLSERGADTSKLPPTMCGGEPSWTP